MPEPDVKIPRPAGGQKAVLQVLPSLVLGGVERGTIDIAGALQSAGWKALVASSGGPMTRELDRLRIQHIEAPLDSKKPWRMRANVPILEELVRTHNVDIVHARSRAPAWSALAAARRTGAHFVTTFHATYNSGGWLGFKRTYNSVMTKGELVIAISEFVAKHLRELYEVDPGRIRVVPRGVDIAKFDPAAVTQKRIIQLIEKWRLFEGQTVILMPARLTHWKGQDTLIEALTRLGRRDLRVLMVGTGRPGQAARLQAMIVRHGLEDVVQLTGECNDMPAAYMLADFVVSASTEPEAFGRVIAEAQAMGKAVIASDHGAGREVLLDEVSGLLIPPGDATALARALDRLLLTDKAELRRMGEAGIAYVRANFTRDLMCERTLAIYEEVLAGVARTPE